MFFFNFPSSTIKEEQTLCYFQQDFVDLYRHNLENFIKSYKIKYPENKDSFIRYTLVKENEINDEDKSIDLSCKSRIKKSKNLFIANFPVCRPYQYKNDSYQEINSKTEKKAYEIFENNENNRSNIYDYFVENFHLNEDTSYVKILNQRAIEMLDGHFDFILIETNYRKVCIEANITLENNYVSIKLIEDKSDIDKIMNIFTEVIQNTEGKHTLKEFKSQV